MTTTNTSHQASDTDQITPNVDHIERAAMADLKPGDIVIWPGGPAYRHVQAVNIETAPAGAEVSGIRRNRPDKLRVIRFVDGGSIVRPAAGHHQITRVVLRPAVAEIPTISDRGEPMSTTNNSGTESNGDDDAPVATVKRGGPNNHKIRPCENAGQHETHDWWMDQSVSGWRHCPGADGQDVVEETEAVHEMRKQGLLTPIRTAPEITAAALAEADEDVPSTCRTPDCDDRTDDGEGWDGFCGSCADRAETVIEGEVSHQASDTDQITPIIKTPKPCSSTKPHGTHYWGVGDVRFADIDMNHCPGLVEGRVTMTTTSAELAANLAAGYRALADMLEDRPDLAAYLRAARNNVVVSVCYQGDPRGIRDAFGQAGLGHGATVTEVSHGDEFDSTVIAWGPVSLEVFALRK